MLASNIMCEAAILAGKDVKKNEVHGMAQRGGSVVSQVKIGDKIFFVKSVRSIFKYFIIHIDSKRW